MEHHYQPAPFGSQCARCGIADFEDGHWQFECDLRVHTDEPQCPGEWPWWAIVIDPCDVR